jgi:cysteine synthase A
MSSPPNAPTRRTQVLADQLTASITATETAVATMTLLDSLPAVLKAIPNDWRGTTYRNENLLERDGFSKSLYKLLQSGDPITTESLYGVGISEDYFRVSSNMNTTLEMALSEQSAIPIDQIFTFGSKTLPVLAVAITAGRPVDLYCGNEPFPFTDEDLDLLKLLSIDLSQHQTPAKSAGPGRTTLAYESAKNGADVDAIIGKYTLYVRNPTAVNPHDIFVIRKRFATPITNPMSEEWMQKIAGIPITANQGTYTPESLADFHAHLQTLAGTDVNPAANPITFTAGLSALCSVWFTMIKRGGCNVLMASTAYGGCSELTDLITKFSPKFKQTRYDVQGAAAMIESIRIRLDELASKPAELMPTTVLLSEIPTNPDMKVPDIKALADLITAYKKRTGKNFVMIVDTTFAPGSQVLAKFRKHAPELSAMVFVSMSKSVSRGLTTAGAIVANHTAEAIDILKGVEAVSAMLDTNAKKDQLCFLCENHTNVEKRCRDAYDVHVAVGEHLVAGVKAATGFDMPLCTVSAENAQEGFTSSTFSFNLPSPKNATPEILADLAQKFVDLLCSNKQHFKPCVSFGQDNGLTYCTVPATSTQGAIKEEDKAKQAVGGVQLTRLSFPPTCDLEAVKQSISEAVAAAYPQ